MKLRTLILSTAALAFAVACDRNEIPNPYEDGEDFTIKSQEEVATFATSEEIHTLLIEGEDITDLSELQVVSAKNIIIKNTSIEHLNIPALQSFSASFQILDNKKLVAIDGLDNLKFIGGQYLIQNNMLLSDISSFLNIKVVNGNIKITQNASLGQNVVPLPSDDFGFGPLRKLIQSSIIDKTNVVLSNNHPEAVTDASMIGIPVGQTIIDYALKSKKDVENFTCFDKHGIVNNLKISGSDISPEDIIGLGDKIKEIQGDLTLENLTFTDGGGSVGKFFEKVALRGGLIVRNLPNATNINMFQPIVGEIHGDLIVEDCPKLPYGWSAPAPKGAGFQNITKIDGDLIIKNAPKFTTQNFRSVTEIGGQLYIEKGKDEGTTLWNFSGFSALKKIGGDITIKNNPHLNSFLGFEKLTYIGAQNITVSADVELKNADGGKPGFGWFKWALNEGIIVNKDCKFNLSKLDGTKIDFATLEPSKN